MTIHHDDEAPEAAYIACDACGAEERVGTGPLPDDWRMRGTSADRLDLCPWCAAFNDPYDEQIP